MSVQVAKREGLDADSLSHAELLRKCRDLKIHFLDAEFPPGEKALVSKKPDAKAKTVQWRRASEFLGPKMALFIDGIEPNDIKQGELGDCWCVVSVCSS